MYRYIFFFGLTSTVWRIRGCRPKFLYCNTYPSDTCAGGVRVFLDSSLHCQSHHSQGYVVVDVSPVPRTPSVNLCLRVWDGGKTRRYWFRRSGTKTSSKTVKRSSLDNRSKQCPGHCEQKSFHNPKISQSTEFYTFRCLARYVCESSWTSLK
jgi:hypothetical protein